MNPNREVVITGVGAVSPIGVGANEFWQALVGRNSGVGIRTRFADFQSPHRIAAPVKNFEAKKYVKPRKAMKIMCGPIQFGCGAAMMAVENAGLADSSENGWSLDPDRVGTVFGTETFFADPDEVADVFQKCTVNKDYQHERWGEFAMREIQPLWMLKYLPNMAASHISIAMDARGPSNSICQGEASGLLAVIEAATLIQRGAVDVVVAGGTGSQMALTATLYRGTDMLSQRIHEPENASRPFDQDRDGMVVGEGAGAIVLESAEHAKARGAKVLARIGGWSRGYQHPNHPQFDDELSYHYRTAVARSSCEMGDVDLVNANASGSLKSDAVEARAIRATFGDVGVVAHKSNFGNLGPGTSAVELIGGIQAIEHGQVAPSLNCPVISTECPVNVITETNVSSVKRVDTVLKSSFSSTGQIGVVVLTK